MRWREETCSILDCERGLDWLPIPIMYNGVLLVQGAMLVSGIHGCVIHLSHVLRRTHGKIMLV